MAVWLGVYWCVCWRVPDGVLVCQLQHRSAALTRADCLIGTTFHGLTSSHSATTLYLHSVVHTLVTPGRHPLHQLEARLALRSSRPTAEAVEDEVQAAMAAEAAQLNAVSTQLHARVDAAGQHISHLGAVSAALLQHIADKDR